MPNLTQISITTTATVICTILATAQTGYGITTFGNPDNYIVPAGQYSGVARLQLNTEIGRVGCVGSLLSGSLYLLTAAHCLTDSGFPNSSTATFVGLPNGSVTIPVASYFINPRWRGDIALGNDIAVVQLAQPAPESAQQYDIYRGLDEVGETYTVVGYGSTGDGNTGAVRRDFLKRSGQNRFDSFGDVLNQVIAGVSFPPETVLLSDFDNGNPENDFFGTYFGLRDTGLGVNEVSTAPADSGAPAFINGQIAGVASFGGNDCGLFAPGCRTTVNPNADGSFGSFTGFTRVSSLSRFADDVLGHQPSQDVSEPSGVLGLVVLGLGGLVLRMNRQDAKSAKG